MKNAPDPAERAIAIVVSDPTVAQLRTRLAELERKLIAVQEETAAALQDLQAQLKFKTSTTGASDEALISGDIDALLQPHQTVDSLRELIRQRRRNEADLAEGVHVVRTRLRQREDAAYDAALRAEVVPEQLKIASSVVDNLLRLCELWSEERQLRDPLYTVGRFDRSDIWATQAVDPGSIRERVERLAGWGYQPTTEQRRRLEALLKAPR